MALNEPAHEVLLLITSKSSDGSDETAHLCTSEPLLLAHTKKGHR